jgi:hypothetical protein
MSSFDRTASDIFSLILEKGPLTLYSASTGSRFPIGTIHRHFKEMKSTGKIKVYEKNKKGRKKMPYGPTSFYGIDYRIQEKLEDYFLKWIDYDEFVSDLVKEGFDSDVVIQQYKSKKLFRKYVHYFAGVDDQLALLQDGSASISREVSQFIGEVLVSMKPEYMKIWEDLYLNCPGIKHNVDTYLKSTISLYKQLQKKSKAH